MLLSKGAHIDAPCHMRAKGGLEANFTPLMLAAMWRHDGMARLLLEKGATVSQVGQAKIERTIDSTTQLGIFQSCWEISESARYSRTLTAFEGAQGL
ncbi:hypothetical protein BJY01DRAFT_215191, partial [Aspergillus pseudoustus]